MTIRRYARAPILGARYRYGTSFAIVAIRENIKNGNIRYTETILKESERLDILAGQAYGDGRLAWIIGAASNVGNFLQVPSGTAIKIPNLRDVIRFTG